MKRILLLAGFIFLFTQAFTQVQRNQVVLEIGTGTGCQFCPGAAMGAEDLLEAGCQVAVIEYHNYNTSDPFFNSYATARCNYYGITGYPTAFFDGVLSYVGGSNTQSMYPQYLPLYTQRYSVPSPLIIDFYGSNVGNNYTITVTITKVSTITSSNLKAHLVLTESHIPYSWQGQDTINDAERLMVPDATGTTISFASGNTVTLTLTFTKDPTWVTANCQLIAFVQDNTTKECLNARKKWLTDLYYPLPTDFSAAPTSGCTPLTVNFTDLSTGATVWNWSFPGGTPSTSTLQNPTVVYNTAGSYDVTLIASNPATFSQGTMIKTAYINPTSAPAAPGTPTGTYNLCENPNTITYATSGSPTAITYTWELQPPAAGVMTPSGTTCVVDWDNTYIGTATLKVRGSNACGDGAWSNPLTISINAYPSVPGTPTGPTTLCQDAANTVYTTSGSPSASGYTWDLTPATAGSIIANGTSATVDWSPAFTGTAEIKVLANSGICQSSWSAPCVVTVNGGPAIFNMTGGGVYCAQGGTGVEVGQSGSQTGVDYTLYFNGAPTTTVVTGTGNPISFGLQTGAGAYTSQGMNASSCSIMMTGTSVVTADPQAPEAPGVPTGPEEVYSGSNPTTDYTTPGGTYATSYAWEVLPVAAGTANGTGLTGTITWEPAFEGTATVKVQGVNSCGGGTYSEEISVDVFPWFVGIGESPDNMTYKVFPNPVRGILTIVAKESAAVCVTLVNLVGTTVLEESGLQIHPAGRLDLSGVSSGIYFLRISGKEGTETVKLIVK